MRTCEYRFLDPYPGDHIIQTDHKSVQQIVDELKALIEDDNSKNGAFCQAKGEQNNGCVLEK